MEVQKKYAHDRTALLLVSINIFLTLIITVSVLLRLGGGHGDSYFLQYRANLGLNAYKVGSFAGPLSFIAFALFIVIFHTVISIRSYHHRRDVSLVVLVFGMLLLSLALIVSNALLVLR